MAYKLLHGLVDIDVNKLNIMINSNNTRGGGTNIVVNRARTAYVGKSFSYRVANSLEQSSIIHENLTVVNCF